MRLRKYLSEYWYVATLAAIIFISFGYRLINLNYNSPFNDEAIYIVLGRYGVFQGDWWTYNASSWMAGQPYVYPPITGIAYMVGGIVGSRFVNVIFGALIIEAVYALTLLISAQTDREDIISGLIAAFVVAASSVAYYLARLATYDLPSFYFFILSLVFLLKAQDENENPGKWFFLSSTLLFLAIMSKIVILIYLPFVFVYAFFRSKKSGPTVYNFWKKYYFIPLTILMLFYAYSNLSALDTYTQSQLVRDYAPAKQIIFTYFENTKYIWYLWIAGTLGMLLKKDVRKWLALTSMALLIFAFHLALHRWPTLDKHSFLSVVFLAPIIGIGLKNIILFQTKTVFVKYMIAPLIADIIVFYCIVSLQDSIRFNRLWDNSNAVLRQLNQLTKPGDKILAEVGAGAILENYDKNYPIYTSTFDWFTYRNQQGEKAYLSAIKDGYFDLIELDGGDQTAEQIHSQMHNVVLNNIKGNYERIYNSTGYIIYRRVF